MNPSEILQKVHVRFEKNTDYPDSTSEDFVTRLAYLDDATSMAEKEIKEGVLPPEQVGTASFAATGLGSEDLAAMLPDFLGFLRNGNMPARIMTGNSEWIEVSANEGKSYEQDGSTPNVFWIEAGKLRSLPAINGTISFPYMKKLTRFVTGEEATNVSYPDPYFYIEYILSMLYLDDGNINQYNAHSNNAQELLEGSRVGGIVGVPIGNGFGLGM